MFGLPENAIRKGLREPGEALLYLRDGAAGIVERRVSRIGQSLYDYEWECAIVLDACRYDLAVENRTARSMFGRPSRVYSLGANSKRWLTRTFDDASPAQRRATHYVTGNVFSAEAVPADVQCTELWKEQFDEDLATVPPRTVTDAAIRIAREQSPERLLVHYMQPHLPPVDSRLDADLDLDFRDGWGDDNPWRAIERGQLDPRTVEDAYRSNLDPVLEDVELLLDNLDAETVVVTADHGNMLGERGRWGHFRSNAIHPGVRMVPWWETSAEDRRTYRPDDVSIAQSDDDEMLSRDEKLRALGYR